MVGRSPSELTALGEGDVCSGWGQSKDRGEDLRPIATGSSWGLASGPSYIQYNSMSYSKGRRWMWAAIAAGYVRGKQRPLEMQVYYQSSLLTLKSRENGFSSSLLINANTAQKRIPFKCSLIPIPPTYPLKELSCRPANFVQHKSDHSKVWQFSMYEWRRQKIRQREKKKTKPWPLKNRLVKSKGQFSWNRVLNCSAQGPRLLSSTLFSFINFWFPLACLH